MTGVPVEVFVDRALYGPDGFYETGGRAGRRGGSFVTSPETGPLFGAVVARAVLAAEPGCAAALRLVCVERTVAQRALHPEGVTSTDRLPDAADVIIANELLDNLAFGIVERTTEGWVPVRVQRDGTTTPDTGGRRIPVAAAASAWVRAARRRLRPGGRLVCFDYAATTAALASRPWTDWVRAFAGQELVADPFAEPGTRDITAVVPWDQLPVPDRTTTQADWLRDHGIDELVSAGAAHWEAHAAAPDLTAMRMRSRIREAEALLDPHGLGAFWVGEWRPPRSGVGRAPRQ